MLRQINVIDIRDTIFIFTGNFLLNLLILKCHNDEDSKEWIKQKTIILDNLHEFYYTHILLSQPQKFADCFKPIVNLKYLKKHIKKSKRDIFVVLNPNQTIHDKHKREIYNGYNTFTGSKKSNVFYLFVHYIQSCLSHDWRDYTEYYGYHDQWKWKKKNRTYWEGHVTI
eukprot:487786_1